MGDTYRSSRVYRDDDDDRQRTTTVTRYKVGPGRGERFVEVEEDRRSGFGRRTSNDLLDNDRRWPGERPRSAYDPGTERSRTYTYEREVERDHRHTPERSRFTTQDSRDSDNWDKRSRADEEVKVERKVEETVEDSRGNEIDRTRTQTEYYTQPTRQQPNIVVQEAPSQGSYGMGRQDPGVMVLREREMDREVVRSRDPYEDDYYYRNDRRDVGPYRGDRDYAMARYDPRRGRNSGYYSDEDGDYYYDRRSRRHRSRDRSRSSSGGRDKHHKLHLAEGALAGAGVTALLQSKRNEYGELPENRGRKVVAGAALGALGTEVLKRAHSAYEERWGDGRESPNHHSRLKTGLGIAAVALAAAGAAKYMQSGKIEKEEAHRGRSRTRGYDSDDGGSRSRSRPASRKRSISTMAKAALGTAATAGIIRHFSKSRSRKGSRSKSKLRRGAEIAGAAAAAGIAGKMWKDHKEKKEERERSRSRADSRSVNGDDYGRRHYSRSRSRSRSIARSHNSDIAADRELGLVEYGNEPLPSDRQDRRRERRRRDRSASSDSDDGRKRSRSRSRLRNMAAAGAAAGAAAVGLNEYKKRKDKKERDRRSRERSREHSRDRSRDRSRERSQDRGDGYFGDNERTQSPPMASGGAYYPPYPPTPGGPPHNGGDGAAGYPPYNNPAATQSQDHQPYVPQDYMGYAPPPPPGPPPAPNMGPEGFGPPPGPPPGPGSNQHPDHVSDTAAHNHQDQSNHTADAPVRPPNDRAPGSAPAASKSVTFIPMSPKSTKTMERHKREQEDASHEDSDSEESENESSSRFRHHRRNSELAHYGLTHRSNQRHSSDSDSDDVELLPERFDKNGAPINGRDATGRRGWSSRSGQFERLPQKSGDWNVKGAWHIGGTNEAAVQKLGQDVTDALDGRKSWLNVVGGVLGGGLADPGAGSHQIDKRHDSPNGDDSRRRRRRRHED